MPSRRKLIFGRITHRGNLLHIETSRAIAAETTTCFNSLDVGRRLLSGLFADADETETHSTKAATIAADWSADQTIVAVASFAILPLRLTHRHLKSGNHFLYQRM